MFNSIQTDFSHCAYADEKSARSSCRDRAPTGTPILRGPGFLATLQLVVSIVSTCLPASAATIDDCPPKKCAFKRNAEKSTCQ